MGLLSLMRLHGWVLGVGGGKLLHWEPWKICSDSLQIWASLYIGALVVLRGTWCLGGGEVRIPGFLKDG